MSEPLDKSIFRLSIRRNLGRDAQRVFFGWKVVATAFTVAVFSWGIGFYGLSVFLHALHQQHRWPVSAISAAITAHFLFSAAIVTRLPELHRRFGVAATTRAAIAATALGLLGWALAGVPWQLFGAALLTGAGYAAISGAAIVAMVSPWFERRRAVALSRALNGASAGGIVFPPLMEWCGRAPAPGANNAWMGRLTEEHRHVQQIEFDHCHDGYRHR